MDAYRWVILFVLFVILNTHITGEVKNDTADLQSCLLRLSKQKEKKPRDYDWMKFRWNVRTCVRLYRKGYFKAIKKNAKYVLKNLDKRSSLEEKCQFCPFCFRP